MMTNHTDPVHPAPDPRRVLAWGALAVLAGVAVWKGVRGVVRRV